MADDHSVAGPEGVKRRATHAMQPLLFLACSCPSHSPHALTTFRITELTSDYSLLHSYQHAIFRSELLTTSICAWECTVPSRTTTRPYPCNMSVRPRQRHRGPSPILLLFILRLNTFPRILYRARAGTEQTVAIIDILSSHLGTPHTPSSTSPAHPGHHRRTLSPSPSSHLSPLG